MTGIDSVAVATGPVIVVATWLVIVCCLLGLVFVVVASCPVDVTIWPAIACIFVDTLPI